MIFGRHALHIRRAPWKTLKQGPYDTAYEAFQALSDGAAERRRGHGGGPDPARTAPDGARPPAGHEDDEIRA